MSGQKKVLSLIVFAALFTFNCCTDKGKSEKVTIAAAANMQYAMGAIVQQFEDKTGISCDLIIGSSGKLTAQIIEGAPYDVFVSADMKYPSEIYSAGLALEPPQRYGYGQLVLWTAKEDIKPSLSLLKDVSIDHIALANPQIAPYGRAAVEVLNHYELYDDLNQKLVYGESVSQTNQFITSKSAAIGFTAMAIVMSSKLKDKGSWTALDKNSYSPIEQGVVLINRDQPNLADTREFYAYLFSKEAKMILKNFGYLTDE